MRGYIASFIIKIKGQGLRVNKSYVTYVYKHWAQIKLWKVNKDNKRFWWKLLTI
jgi:hypothetical protein